MPFKGWSDFSIFFFRYAPIIYSSLLDLDKWRPNALWGELYFPHVWFLVYTSTAWALFGRLWGLLNIWNVAVAFLIHANRIWAIHGDRFVSFNAVIVADAVILSKIRIRGSLRSIQYYKEECIIYTTLMICTSSLLEFGYRVKTFVGNYSVESTWPRGVALDKAVLIKSPRREMS